MDFEFSEEQQAFAKEVVAFCDEHDDIEIFDVTRENMAQIVDTPERRAFMKEIGHKGWLGMTWPKEYGGAEGEGVYEYILNEELAGRGGPQIGKGVGIIGKTVIAHGSDFLKEKFLPMILENDVEFAVGYSEPNAGSDAASMRLKGVKHTTEDGREGWLLQRPEDLDHLGPLRRVVLVRRPHRPRQQAHGHHAHAHPDGRPGHHHQRHLDHGRRAHQRGVARQRVRARRVRRRRGQPRVPLHLPGARPGALHHVHVRAHQAAPGRADRVRAHRRARRRAAPDDPVVRARMAQLHTDAEVARVMGLKFVAEAVKVEALVREGKEYQPPTVIASEYKLFATELSKRLADASMDIGGPGTQLRVRTEDAPMAGRAESTYRYTVIDTIGGGASEIQKNIIARRGLGLPKNF